MTVSGGDLELVRLLQFGDSTFPVGAFAFSGGLESAVQERIVTDAATLGAYTRTAVDQAAQGDGIALLHAHRAATAGDVDALVRIDRRVYARKLSAETRTMTTRMGRKHAEISAVLTQAPLLAEWRARIESGATHGCFPVSLATAFALQGVSERAAFTAHQYGVAATILSAALRLMRIGHVETQQLLYEINAGIEASFAEIEHATLDDMASFAPVMEILAAVHVRAHVRLFMN